jgi:hypothetical protein
MAPSTVTVSPFVRPANENLLRAKYAQDQRKQEWGDELRRKAKIEIMIEETEAK